MDGWTNMEKRQSAGNHKKKRKDQKCNIYGMFGELRNFVRRTKFVRRATDVSSPHIGSELNANIEDNLSSPGISPYK